MASSLTIAIADIHGEDKLLQSMHEFIAEHASEYEDDPEIVYLGDIGDRGDNSKACYELVHKAVTELNAVVIKGNHDDWFLRAVRDMDDEVLNKWLGKGGRATLDSYMPGNPDDAIDLIYRKFGRHLDIVANAKPYHVRDNVCFTHAGIVPGVALEQQEEYNLMWVRGEFLNHVGVLDHVVVHGHTVVGDLPVVTENRISLDTGANVSGKLTAMVIDWKLKTVRFFQTGGDENAVVEVEPVFHNRGHGLATDFLFTDEAEFAIAA